MDDDWYSSTTWTRDVEQRFELHLRRARKKDQYLRIQASCLVDTHPEVSLQLIDRFFDLQDPFSPALALDVRARALAKLGRVEDAFATYEAVLEQEVALPSVKTNAFADMAVLVVTRGLEQYYSRILEVLDSHTDRLVFPVLRFTYHACRAVIFRHLRQLTEARGEAHAALEQAARKHSGLQYHSALGLVGETQGPLLELLRGFRDA